jgi:hypothetical protein
LTEIDVLEFLKKNPTALHKDTAEAIGKSLKSKSLLAHEGARNGGRWIPLVVDDVYTLSGEMRRKNLRIDRVTRLRIYFCAASVLFTDIFVLPRHAIMSADDDYAHCSRPL